MNHFDFARTSLKNWRCNTLTAMAAFSFALFAAGTCRGQIAASTEPVRVTLTPAASLPVISGGSVHTTIATDLGGQSAPEPWRVSLVNRGRNEGLGGFSYSVKMTNVSSRILFLPIGTDGHAIWNACQKSDISEVNISLRVAGRIQPAANLPIVHSCAALSSSSVAVAPGASVVYQGSLVGPLLAPEGSGISAVVSVCSASYSLNTVSSVTTRHCEIPAISNSVSQTIPERGSVAPLPRVR